MAWQQALWQTRYRRRRGHASVRKWARRCFAQHLQAGDASYCRGRAKSVCSPEGSDTRLRPGPYGAAGCVQEHRPAGVHRRQHGHPLGDHGRHRRWGETRLRIGMPWCRTSTQPPSGPGRWHGRQVIDDLAAAGIIVRSPSSRGVAEEAPGAYKDRPQSLAPHMRRGLLARWQCWHLSSVSRVSQESRESFCHGR